ncbi:PEGA domain-containing protein [Patescibacteria group bacterium]|nr:PEGA domain-containing protein [Patescibacteria group bacterium]
MNKATLAVLTAFFFILAGLAVAVALARGYRPDFANRTLLPTGILVATSDPDGAEVLINGKLETATNNTINLAPGKYLVRIQKDGFSPWEKQVEIKKEEVFKTNAFLFPALADLRPLTFTGSLNPVVSPDQTKIVYGVASASARLNGGDGNGVWVMDTSRTLPAPIPGGGDFRQVFINSPALSLSDANFAWSADSKQVLAYYGSLATPSAAYLLDTDRLNDNPTPETSNQLTSLFDSWKALTAARYAAQLAKLPENLRATLATSAATLEFSPDETKILYTATASAHLPAYLLTYLPGTDPTPETRNLQPGNTYVYDLKEDRNYLIPVPAGIPPISWFPSSRHLLEVDNNQISVMEYDGTNKAVLFNGTFSPASVFVWPNWSKVVILTNLGSTDSQAQNLYTVNLR